MTQKNRKIQRVLIANRGEIAVRIVRSLKLLGMESVVVYSEADRSSLATVLADYSIALRGVTSKETYLNQDLLLRAARFAQVDAVHPGYGFLSENAEFAERCQQQGIYFIGPQQHALHTMGNKIEARKLMQQHGVPVLPGSDRPIESNAHLESLAKQFGYPLMLKAALGGGGRGIRIVRTEEELIPSFESCLRETDMAFNSKDIFCERFLENPHHIEIQVLFDEHGNGVHLFERDCSIQRRRQKLVEEAPSSFLGPDDRKRLGNIAVQAGKAVGYVGVGTVEFICDSPQNTYFMEMNTRIQVEHPVTEMITGVDLIAQQLMVAQGLPLSMRQEDLQVKGHAIEVRINAENADSFLPQTGFIKKLSLPMGPFVRVDSHLYAGYEIPGYYDSLLAKIIAWGETRELSRLRLLQALDETVIVGCQTNAPFHRRVLKHPAFVSGHFDTSFCEKLSWEHEPPLSSEAQKQFALAASAGQQLYYAKR